MLGSDDDSRRKDSLPSSLHLNGPHDHFLKPRTLQKVQYMTILDHPYPLGLTKVETSEEAIVFQGHHSHKSTPDLQSNHQVIRDPANMDRAFRMFSLEIKSQK